MGLVILKTALCLSVSIGFWNSPMDYLISESTAIKAAAMKQLGKNQNSCLSLPTPMGHPKARGMLRVKVIISHVSKILALQQAITIVKKQRLDCLGADSKGN